MQSVLPYLLGSTGCLVLALVVAWAFYTGHLHSDKEFRALQKAGDQMLAAERDKSAKLAEANARLQAALDIERATNERLSSSGQLTNQLVGALITIAGEKRQAGPGGPQNPPPPQAVTAGNP